jgi:hypothetical protein
MSSDKIQKLLNSLANTIDGKSEIATPLLAAKLAKAVEAYPGDHTIGSIYRVVDKMVDNNTMFIRKSELKSLYGKLYSRNTKFAEVFSDEIGLVDNVSAPKLYERDDSVELNSYQVGDQVLANALNSVFDKNAPLKMYSQELANKALSTVANTLEAWNLKPSTLSVDAGNEKFLVIKASYETPKGISGFYVPVQTSGNKVLEASVFMGNGGPQELNHVSIKNYLTCTAGTKSKITASGILEVITKAASENREVSDAEIALTRLTATRQGKSEFFADQVVGLKVAEASVQDVQLPKSDEFKTFEEQFTSAHGIAGLEHGAEKVKIARECVVRELVGYGHKNPQVVVAKSDPSGILFSVSLDAGRVGFSVPVKMAEGKVVKPSVMLCNGSVSSFSEESINELYISNATDYKAAASASPQFGLTAADLLNNVRDALAKGNNAMAEDALNVLASTGNEQAYALGFSALMNGLAKKASAPKTECSKMIKNSSSEHPVCSHTGLPAHKVYQDKDGNCRPLYRRGMDETYEVASFNNYKIFG